jgi:hypothetical protein
MIGMSPTQWTMQMCACWIGSELDGRPEAASSRGAAVDRDEGCVFEHGWFPRVRSFRGPLDQIIGPI